MNATELFNRITGEPKWYAGYISPQAATQIKKRFETKTLSFERLTELFNHFGYYLTASWDKQIVEQGGNNPIDQLPINIKNMMVIRHIHGDSCKTDEIFYRESDVIDFIKFALNQRDHGNTN